MSIIKEKGIDIAKGSFKNYFLYQEYIKLFQTGGFLFHKE